MSVRNAEAFIGETVQAVLRQSLADFELIIIDDGSTDNTARVLDAFSDRRIRRFTQPHRGLTPSLNRGLACAAGEFVARNDADDISLPGRLEKQVAFLHRHPGVAVVGSNCYKIDEHGRRTKQSNLPQREACIKWNLLFYNCLRHSTVMFRRREILDLGGYSPEMDCAQDYDLWLRAAGRWPFANLAEPLVCLRLARQGSITVSRAACQHECAENARLAMLQRLSPHLHAEPEAYDQLRSFLTTGRLPDDIPAAHACCTALFAAFCASDCARYCEPRDLRNLRAGLLGAFAWAWADRGDPQQCIAHLQAAFTTGADEPLVLPAPFSPTHERLIEAARRRAVGAGRRMLARQQIAMAWAHHRTGRARAARRCLLRALYLHPSLATARQVGGAWAVAPSLPGDSR